MEHGIVIVPQLDLICADKAQRLGKLGGVHVRLIIERSTVADYEHLIGVHGVRRLLENLFLFELELELALLILRI